MSRVGEATTIDQVWSMAYRFFGGFGFSGASYGFTRFLHRHSLGDPRDAIFLTTGNLAKARGCLSEPACVSNAGVSIIFPEASTRSKGALYLIADPAIGKDQVAQIWDARCDEIKAVAYLMHFKIITLPQPCANRSLTERQRQALEWVADGKTTQDAAALMDVSAAMVEKHLRLAREALSVATTTQAVAKAALLNLIFQRGPTDPVVGKS
jgi:LuxR family transcriptional regulator